MAALLVADCDAAPDERRNHSAVGDRPVTVRLGRRVLYRGLRRGAHLSNRASHVRQATINARGRALGKGSKMNARRMAQGSFTESPATAALPAAFRRRARTMVEARLRLDAA